MAELLNRHALVVGGSGSGKSTAEIEALVDVARRGNSAIVVLDPHTNSLAYNFLSHCVALGMDDRVIYDRLSDLDNVLAWDFLSPSPAKAAHKRESQNKTRCSRFAEILLRRRGKSSAADSPSLEEWIPPAVKLYLYQRTRRPLSDLRYAFAFDHPKFEAMLRGCTDEDTRYKFESAITSGKGGYDAVARLINGLLESSAFLLRTQEKPRFDLKRHLDNKGILIVEGGVGDDLSKDALQVMLGAVSQEVISYCRARYAATNSMFPLVTMTMDEATNYKMIGESEQEVDALAECRKMGLGIRILIQYFNFPNETIRKGVVQNCATIKCFGCDDYDTRTKLAKQFGKPEDEEDYSDKIDNLKRGERIARYKTEAGKFIRHERGKMMPDPFGFSVITKQRTLQALQLIWQRDEYYHPGTQSTPKQRPAATEVVIDDSPTLGDEVAAEQPTNEQIGELPIEEPSIDDDDPLGIV